jgi:hypothetical protein
VLLDKHQILTGMIPMAHAQSFADVVLAHFNRELPYKKMHRTVLGSQHDIVIWELMSACWSIDPGERPSKESIIQALQKVKLRYYY